MVRSSVSLVLPAYNEAQNLGATVKAVIDRVSALGIEFEILIVDDGSTDATPRLAAELSRQCPEVRVITLPRNRGYGAALRAGFDAAQCQLVFFTDADGQFRFDQLPQFLNAIDSVDMVLGYREDRQDPWHRKLNSKMGNWLARTLLGVRVRDINCAYKLFRRELLQSLPLASDGAMINTELLALAARAGWSFRELPVRHYPREFGTPTGANPIVIVRTFQEYFTVRRRVSGFSPTARLSSAEASR